MTCSLKFINHSGQLNVHLGGEENRSDLNLQSSPCVFERCGL